MKKILSVIFGLLLSASASFAGSQQTSSTLASTIITNSRYYLNETTADFWTDAELLVYLNEGTVDIVSRTRCLEGSEAVSLAANTIEYSITGPYIAVTTAIYTDQNGVKKGLVKNNPQAVGHSRDNVPNGWYDWGGKIGIFPAIPVITDANLAIGSTTTAVSTSAFAFIVNDKVYSKAAVAAGTALGTTIIPATKYGAVALDVNAAGTITANGAYANAVGYTTAALAAAALPPVADGQVRLGYVTMTKSDGAFTLGTTALNAANVTAAYTDSAPTATVYFVSKPAAVASSGTVLVPAYYDKALTLYIAAQGLLKERQLAKAAQLMAAYYAELDRYRQDFVDQTKEPEMNVTR